MVKLSIVAPIYNEEENILLLHEAITNAVTGKVESYEIVLVNDGSRDRSASILTELAERDPAVKVIHFTKNCGQTAAIYAGMKESKGELVALIDADLQTDPRDIFKLMPYIPNMDFVNGKRVKRQDNIVKKVSSRVGNGVRNWLTGDEIYDTGCPMKLMKREVADSYYLYEGMHRFLPTLAKINGFKVIEIAVSHHERQHGVSKYGVFNRAFVGLMDAIVIGWLRKRVIRYQIRGQ
ncbi:glycosyltransferase family 2 protein [Paenibacillus sacheonensis]|uniref:Glycosyltransferase n=1 Tax=Paenibacillus sacheonensis TaxID=742054 RepID=A0A7X5C4K8_9BACL|nr:glycosyltransferase family 2 protein [Paenibacillus sacheonensis]MBM7568622.1 glycosyltransferase involved in cell wall biosynthesis [Paenibacillus sacheonensis]NBC72484.1 glycosyltransferase [Paenibacillus sacheonensis]